MANTCRICGAEINLVQTQRLADGNCICRSCRKKGFRDYDYMHDGLHNVKAHLNQVERGTKLWEHYFVPREKTKDKTQKLKRFGSRIYVAEDIGLMAFIQTDYKFFLFGKSIKACVYRIADLRSYEYEKRTVQRDGKTENKSVAVLCFVNTEGLYEAIAPLESGSAYEKMKKYFDTLFGIQKTLGNAVNTWKQQMTAAKDLAAGFSAAVRGDTNAETKAEQAIHSLDAAIYGDRSEWIRKADAALAAFPG